VQPALVPIMVNMAKDAKLAAKMAAAYKLSAQTLMASVRWNLCLDEPKRREAGLDDSCWWMPYPTPMNSPSRHTPSPGALRRHCLRCLVKATQLLHYNGGVVCSNE
jgi:hypothetical protein